MIGLYIGVASLFSLAGILVLLSLRSRQTSQTDQQLHRSAQRDFYRQRQRELAADLASGLIDSGQLAELERELDRQLVAESTSGGYAPVQRSRRGYILAVLVLIPATALIIYDRLGYRQDLALQQLQTEIVSEGADDLRWQRYKELLDAILARRPDSAEHLMMMASLFRQQGDFAGALPYYQRLEALYPEDPNVLAQLGQARYLVGGRKIDGQTRSLLDRALAINPMQGTALGVLGIDAFASGRYLDALAYWQKLLTQLPPDSSEIGVISAGIVEAKRLAEDAGNLQSLDINVSVAPELGAAPQGILFVVAKSTDGNPMPVAALRVPLLTAQQWPINVQLTDSDVIRQGMSLDDFSELALSAHISLVGTAIRRDGDWVAKPVTVEPAKVSDPLSLLITEVQGR
jgi:cytochrome c-type biogenesis protein CcmH